MTRTIITDLADVQAGDLVTAAHRVGAVEHEFSEAVWSDDFGHLWVGGNVLRYKDGRPGSARFISATRTLPDPEPPTEPLAQVTDVVTRHNGSWPWACRVRPRSVCWLGSDGENFGWWNDADLLAWTTADGVRHDRRNAEPESIERIRALAERVAARCPRCGPTTVSPTAPTLDMRAVFMCDACGRIDLATTWAERTITDTPMETPA